MVFKWSPWGGSPAWLDSLTILCGQTVRLSHHGPPCASLLVCLIHLSMFFDGDICVFVFFYPLSLSLCTSLSVFYSYALLIMVLRYVDLFEDLPEASANADVLTAYLGWVLYVGEPRDAKDASGIFRNHGWHSPSWLSHELLYHYHLYT